jgi:putative transposase
VRVGKRLMAGEAAPVSQIAEALLVSRQSLYKPSRPRRPAGRPAAPRPQLREVDLGERLDPATMPVEEALVILARRHVAYGYRMLWAKLRQAGYPVNRKKVHRLLKLWGFLLTRPRPRPKAQGRPFDISRPNQLWQTDMTAVWCGEDGWAYLTFVVDCFDRSILGWSFTLRCRARDFSPALEMAWSAAWPYGPPEACELVLRHDNGTQFTYLHYREVAATLGMRLSRTRYRHPDGNALVERLFLSLKREEVWPAEYADFEQARVAVARWITEYNCERPHQTLKYRTPSEVRREALESTQSAA